MKKMMSFFLFAMLAAGITYFLVNSSTTMANESDQQILERLAQQIRLDNFHTNINGKKFAIDSEDAALAFKMDVLKESILKMALRKTPALYESTKNHILTNRPAYINFEQEDNISSKVLLGNTLACDVRYGEKITMSAERFSQLPCLGLFDNPGGYARTKPVTIFFEEFDVTKIDDISHQQKWDDIIKKEMIKIAIKTFIKDYRENNGKVIL